MITDSQNQVINALSELRKYIDHLSPSELDTIYKKSAKENPWFIKISIQTSLASLKKYLDKKSLEKWLSKYSISIAGKYKVGLVLAGNIPLVGFHDLICVISTGQTAIVKLSRKDTYLLKLLIDQLKKISPYLNEMIVFDKDLNDVDAIIATGSDNSARYINYNFSAIPRLIRKNRTGIAILNGTESKQDFELLSNDIFLYFGLGCRNVSKIYLPVNCNVEQTINQFKKPIWLSQNQKYSNNYLYNKSIAQIGERVFHDNGYLIAEENNSLVSPIAVLFYEFYQDAKSLQATLKNNKEKIQVILSKEGWFKNCINFGEAQFPELWDYADGIDTIRFINNTFR